MAQVALYAVAIAGLTILVGSPGKSRSGTAPSWRSARTPRHCSSCTWPGRWRRCSRPAPRSRRWPPGRGRGRGRLRGPYLAGVTLMLAVALPSLATRFTGVFGGDQGLASTSAPRLPSSGRTSRSPLGGLDLLRRADRPGPAGQPGPQPDRPELAGGARRRDRGRAERPERGRAAGARLRGQRRLAGLAGACRHHHHARLTRLLYGHAIHHAARPGGTRRPGQPGRSDVGKPDHRPGAHVRHRRGHQQRPVQLRAANIPIAAYGVCSSSSSCFSPTASRAWSAACWARPSPSANAGRRLGQLFRPPAPASEHSEEGAP